MISLAITTGVAVGGLAFRRFAPGLGRAFARRGFAALRGRQAIRAAAGGVGVGLVASVATEGAFRLAGEVIRPSRTEVVRVAPSRGRLPQAPMRRDTVITPGPVPVTFVKSWQACEAIFAIDSQGQRWVWRPKLGIWKRIRNTRNIVISGKDLLRAKRLVRISKRLNKMRTQLR